MISISTAIMPIRLGSVLIGIPETVASFLDFFSQNGPDAGPSWSVRDRHLLIPLHVQGDTLANVFSRPH